MASSGTGSDRSTTGGVGPAITTLTTQSGGRTGNASLGNAGGAKSPASSSNAGGAKSPASSSHPPSSPAGGSSIGTTATGGKASSSASTTGGSSSGGTTSNTAIGGRDGTAGGNATSTGASEFALAWEDDFDNFDSKLWQLMTHSWDGNLAQFSTDNATTKNGVVAINLTTQSSDKTKPYRGVEMRSTKTLTYGKVSARVRFAKGPGVVSGLVTIYTPWPADDWNEIDIEHLGKSPTESQLNCMVYTGTPTTPPVTESVKPTQDPLVVDFGFDVEADFHEYDIEWTPNGVRFLVDGKLWRSWTKSISLMKLPQNILFTIWASDSASWAGAIASSTLPTAAEMDWIRVYDWKPKD